MIWFCEMYWHSILVVSQYGGDVSDTEVFELMQVSWIAPPVWQWR